MDSHLVCLAEKSHLEGINRIRQDVSLQGIGHNLCPFDPEDIEQNDLQFTLAIVVRAKVVGYLTIYHFSGLLGDMDGMLEIFVLSKNQDRGLGKQLMGKCISRLEKNGMFSRIILTVLYTNIRAKLFYEKLGFKTVKQEKEGNFLALQIKNQQ